MRISRGLAVLGVTAVVIAAGAVSAGASVTGTSGAAVAVATPPSVAPGALTSDTQIRAFDERVVTLTVDATMATWTWQSGGWAYSSQTFQRGTCLQSHLVHRERISGTSATPLTGTATFGSPILFIVPTNNFTVPVIGTTIRPLDLTDGPLGSPATTYSAGIASRGSDGSGGGDSVTETAASTLSLGLASPTGDVMDEIRVVTGCSTPVVPETRQVVLLSTAAAVIFGGAVVRARRWSVAG
jgi:hypothetical protein